MTITCPECGSDNLEVTYDSDEEVADYEDYDSDDIEGNVDSYDDLAEGPDVGEDLHESWGHAGGPPKPEDYDDDESFEAAQDSYDSWVEHELDARKDEPRESRAKSGFNEAFVFKPGEGGDWGNIEEVPNEQKVDYEALPSEPTEEHTYRTRIIHNGVGETREFKAMSSKEAMIKVAKWLFSGQMTDNGIIGEGGSVTPFSARNLGEFFTMHRMSGNPEQVVWIKNQDNGLYIYDQEGKQFTQKQQYKRESVNTEGKNSLPFREAEDDVGSIDNFTKPTVRLEHLPALDDITLMTDDEDKYIVCDLKGHNGLLVEGWWATSPFFWWDFESVEEDYDDPEPLPGTSLGYLSKDKAIQDIIDKGGSVFSQAPIQSIHEAEDDMGNVDRFPEPEGVESKVFDQPGDFEALKAATDWLIAKGYSVGRLCNDAPVGFRQGK